MTVLTSSSHRAGQGVLQDHFGSLIHHMVLKITLGSHFRLRSDFSENSVIISDRNLMNLDISYTTVGFCQSKTAFFDFVQTGGSFSPSYPQSSRL